ncbi:MAG: MurR/RpiR family transcriptional regulator [Anaerolineaceae bacterium]|nr:MurR/RpiR family transcriptional regulator [Anaerolineaceae bacterium]
MADTGVLLQIKKMLPSLPAQERKVGEYLLQHPHEAVNLTITSLAKLARVSNTTISRFCRRMGFDGYPQIKIALAREWGTPSTLVYVEPLPDDTLTTVAQRSFAANIQALQDIQRSLDLDVLDRVVDAIMAARRVDLYSAGGASIAARELHLKCMHLGINANAFLDSQMQVMSAASLTDQDVAIGISHTGRQSQVAEALGLAREGGATTVALTSYPGTPVASASDILLSTATLAAAITYDSPTVRNAQLAIIDVIYEAMLLKGTDLAREKMARVARAISEHTSGPGRRS